MTPIRLDDRDDLRILRDRINRALSTIRGELGLDALRCGSIRFDAGGTSCKITVLAEATVDGKSKAEQDFDLYHGMFGLKPEHFMARFTYRDLDYEVVGIAPTRRKFPIIARTLNSQKKYFFPTSIVSKLRPTKAAADAVASGQGVSMTDNGRWSREVGL